MKPPFNAAYPQNMAGYTYYPASPPPPNYQTYYYSTSTSTSPSPDNVRTFYPPQYQSIPIISPGPRRSSAHARTASFSAPRMSEWHPPPGYSPQAYYASQPTYTSPPPRYSPQGYEHVPNEEDFESPKASSRPRRASHSTGRRPSSHHQEPKPRKPKPEKTHRQATEEDRLRHNIGPGYSTKNWDPTERPIILLGSVFDANSVGNYIYDWTVAHYKSGTPMSEVAGDLWVLLIKFGGRMKRAEAGISNTRSKSKRIGIQEAINKGQLIWKSFETLLKKCEQYMWQGAQKDPDTGATIMPKDAGSELVKGFFDRERKLRETEAVMQQLRNWIMDFEGNRATEAL